MEVIAQNDDFRKDSDTQYLFKISITSYFFRFKAKSWAVS